MAITPPILLPSTCCAQVIQCPSDDDFDQSFDDILCLVATNADGTWGERWLYAYRYPDGNRVLDWLEEHGNPGYTRWHDLHGTHIYWANTGYGGQTLEFPYSEIRPPTSPPPPVVPVPKIMRGQTIIVPPCSKSWYQWEMEPEAQEPEQGWTMGNGSWNASSDDPKGWAVTYGGGQYTVECPEDVFEHASRGYFEISFTRYDDGHDHWHIETIALNLHCVIISISVAPAGSGSGSGD